VTIVIDASVSLAWCFDDENTPETDALLDLVESDGAMVPAHWPVEVCNSMLQAEKRGRIALIDMNTRLEQLSALPLAVENQRLDRAWGAVLTLARAETLTAYDAAYLELALRRSLPLATLDQQLASAAKRRGVRLLV
jgi:predicted nucleic acid-binding protein